MEHVLIIASVVGLLTLVAIWYGRGLYRIPGPFLASILPIDRLRSAYVGQQFVEHPAYHRKYGGFVRVGPNHVSIGTGAAISQIYAIGSKFVKVSLHDLAEQC